MEYIALLRGINVSGQKKMKMVDFKAVLINLGLQDAVTYIQSGNAVFSSDEKSRQTLEEKIKQGILDAFGFHVPVLVLSREELEKIRGANPFDDPKKIEENKLYYVLLKNAPEEHLVNALQKENYENETFAITKNCIYLTCSKGYGNAKCNNNFFEKKLKVPATTRNHKTVERLLQLAND